MLLYLFVAVVTLVILPAVGVRPLAAQERVQWHGYAQLRYGRTDPSTGFSVRRAKLWATGPVPGVDHLDFKVQGIFRDAASGAFVLQDAFVEYRSSTVSVKVGQLVPDFSLQRSQPDYLVPLVERAAVVDNLIPGARTLARDIGAQGLFISSGGTVHIAAGIFNGRGANRSVGAEGDFLGTGRLVLAEALTPGVRGGVGGSVAWRHTKGTDVGVLSTTSGAFAGRDVRWGLEGHLEGDRWEIQGEYLHADLEGQYSRGYYALADAFLTPRDQVALSVERLQAVGSSAPDDPWYVAGYTRYLNAAVARRGRSSRRGPGDSTASSTSRRGGFGNPLTHGAYPTKVMTDLRVQVHAGRAQVGAAVQLQVFVH